MAEELKWYNKVASVIADGIDKVLRVDSPKPDVLKPDAEGVITTYRIVNGDSSLTYVDFVRHKDKATSVSFILPGSKGEPMKAFFQIPEKGAAIISINGLAALDANDDLTPEKTQALRERCERIVQSGKFTKQDAADLRQSFIDAVHPNTWREAREEGLRMTDHSITKVQEVDGAYYKAFLHNKHPNIVLMEPGHAFIINQIGTDIIDGYETVARTGKKDRDIVEGTANLSKKELAAIQAKFEEYGADRFLTNAELKDLGTMAKQALTTTRAEDKAREGGRGGK